MKTLRGKTYRARLDHLSDEKFRFAVAHALDSLEYMPTIEELLDFAASAPEKPVDVAGLITDGGGPKVSTAEGLEIFRRELAALGVPDPTRGARVVARAIESDGATDRSTTDLKSITEA
jgi:hypothetical protein